MSINWMRRMGIARLVALAVLSIFIGGAVVDSAEARIGRSRGGGFGSFGSRGSRTFGSGSSSRMQPVTPSRSQPGGALGANNARNVNNRGSWFQRNPLMSGLIGAIAGTVIGSMLMNALGGMGGLGNFVGIMMLLLLAMALFAAFRMLKANKQPTFATGTGNGLGGAMGGGMGMPNRTPFGNTYDAPPASASREFDAPHGASSATLDQNTQTLEQGLAAITLEDRTMTRERLMDALSARFFQTQEAWSSGDRATLMAGTTKTMFDEFSQDLNDMEREGERNIIKNIVIRSFELTEAWQEDGWEFVTARINARLLDYTERAGKVVEGDAVNPTNFSEFWTFVRPRGKGEWRLSAINQEA